jgi:hypothetical protein
MRPGQALAILITGAMLLAPALAQSLGDVARQQRQKQQSKDTPAAAKVITNEDIPESADDASDTSGQPTNRGRDPFRASSSVVRSGEQFKAAILAQKHAIASLQSQVDKLNASIHFVEANLYRSGAQYNQRQQQKQEDVLRLQQQLDAGRQKLEQMQEAARKAGFGNAVYDP